MSNRTAQQSTLFESPGAALIALRKAEAGLLAGLNWMPYPSDVEGDASIHLQRDLEALNVALGVVRAAKDEAEKRVIGHALVMVKE